MVQNYEKMQNTCSIISRSYSFKEVEVVSLPRRDATEELKNFKFQKPFSKYRKCG